MNRVEYLWNSPKRQTHKVLAGSQATAIFLPMSVPKVLASKKVSRKFRTVVAKVPVSPPSLQCAASFLHFKSGSYRTNNGHLEKP